MKQHVLQRVNAQPGEPLRHARPDAFQQSDRRIVEAIGVIYIR
jgi:hypothetical protein